MLKVPKAVEDLVVGGQREHRHAHRPYVSHYAAARSGAGGSLVREHYWGAKALTPDQASGGDAHVRPAAQPAPLMSATH